MQCRAKPSRQSVGDSPWEGHCLKCCCKRAVLRGTGAELCSCPFVRVASCLSGRRSQSLLNYPYYSHYRVAAAADVHQTAQWLATATTPVMCIKLNNSTGQSCRQCAARLSEIDLLIMPFASATKSEAAAYIDDALSISERGE